MMRSWRFGPALLVALLSALLVAAIGALPHFASSYEVHAQRSPPPITLDGSDIVLQWPSDPAHIRYDVYRSTRPYFTPDGSTLLAFDGGTSYRDRCVAGDVNANYTYVIRGVRSDGTYDDLPAVGAFSFWLASAWSSPSTLYVDAASGADAGRCTDPAHPCASIGYALCRAWRGDTVQVAQGTYPETLTINMAVTLRGGYEPLGWSRCLGNCTTEIHGDLVNPTVSVDTTQAERAILDGFKITGGNIGIIVGLSSLDVMNAILTDNHASYAGGGMHVDHAAVTITNSLIYDNTASHRSGALHVISTIGIPATGSSARIANSTVTGNRADNSNGVWCSLSGCSAVNSIFSNHGGQDFDGSPSWVVSYTDSEICQPGDGNICEAPHFGDPASDDYHLQAGSPCIDAGSNASMPAADFENDPRPLDGDADGGAVADMGADEYRPAWHFPLGYGPYRAGQAPGGSAPSPQQIGQDLEILEQKTRTLRTYGSCPPELAIIPPIAASHGMDIYQGADLSANPAYNDAQIGCFVDLANTYPNIVTGVIGNESLTLGVLTEAQLAGYLSQAGAAVAIPVTSGEGWNVWCNEANTKPRCQGRSTLAAAADLIMGHTHPYWEAVPIEHAALHVVATYLLLRDLYPGRDVIIGETGWPTGGDVRGAAVPGVENQRRFIEELWDWSNLYSVPVLYFEAFDEDWKAGTEGEVGRYWGVYDAGRTPKHADLDWRVPTPEPAPAEPAVTIAHPIGDTDTATKPNCTVPVVGRAYGAGPGWKVKVEVFTDAWYTQDKWYAGGLAPIGDGAWAMPEIYLAGQGAYNDHRIRATLVDETGTAVISDEVTGIVRTNDCTP